MVPTGSNMRPYCGKEPYIFVSYAHRNEAEAYKIITRMQAEGYRVWYDRGVDPGTEWAENIAERVASCDYFIAFITKEYLKSTNCLDELSFARDKEKKRLLVYLENVTLPDGISMRSNRLQAIHKYAYTQEEEFFENLFRAKGIDNSRIPPDSLGSDLYVAKLPLQSTERTCEPASGESAGQKQDSGEPRSAAAVFSPVRSIVAHFMAMLWGHRRLFFLTAAVCTVLFLAASGLFEKSGTGASESAAAKGDAAKKETPEAVLDSGDLCGMAFGISLEDVRAILTSGAAAKENSAYYDSEGMLVVEYVPAGDAYGKEVKSITDIQTFHGRKIKSLIVCFDADGLYQVNYVLDAAKDADGRELLKELNSKYGNPSSQYELVYQWNMGSDIVLHYFLVTDVDEDVVRISVPHETYFDMRGFSWGMTPDEATAAEAEQELPLTLTKSGQNSDGYPYQFYEGEWEICGNPVDLLTLNFIADELVEMKYILSGRSFNQVVADCTALYGQGEEMAQDGSAMGWNVRMFQPDGGSSVPIAFSVVKAENGVRLTFRNLERYQALQEN